MKNLKKSFKARTTGKLKRKVKSATNPFYGKKGFGMGSNGLYYWLFIGWWVELFKWLFIGLYYIFKFMFYDIPKYLIKKYKEQDKRKQLLINTILLSILLVNLIIISIDYIIDKETVSVMISLLMSIVVGYFIFRNTKKYLLYNAETAENMTETDEEINNENSNESQSIVENE